MTSAELTHQLPVLLAVAFCFALLGWWIRGKKKTPVPVSPVSAKPAAVSNSDRQRLRDLDGKLRASEAALQETRQELAALRTASVSKAELDASKAELVEARKEISGMEIQLRKSRDLQASLQAQANDAGKKNQSRAITLENELAAARTEIQRLRAISDPQTDGMKRLEGEIETVRTRLRAVESQLSERNAELNALKAKSLAATTRPPRTIATHNPASGPLNLLGVDAPAPASAPSLTASVQPAPGTGILDSAPDAAGPALPGSADAPVAASTPAPSFSGASAILGKPVEADDLSLIGGITPEIRQILAAAGLTTWQALGGASPEHLRALLTEAGDHSAVAHSLSWPEQARLAAGGQWFQLKSLQEKLLTGPPETAYV